MSLGGGAFSVEHFLLSSPCSLASVVRCVVAPTIDVQSWTKSGSRVFEVGGIAYYTQSPHRVSRWGPLPKHWKSNSVT